MKTFETFYDNGNIRQRDIVNLNHRMSEFFDSDGDIVLRENSNKQQFNGKRTFFYKNGNIDTLVNYKHDKIKGLFVKFGETKKVIYCAFHF